MGASGTTDFERISREARERLVAEVRRTVSDVSAAVDEAVDSVRQSAQADARHDLVAARVEQLAREVEPLHELSTELADRAVELEREVSRLVALAAEAADALRALAPAPPAPAAPAAPPAADPDTTELEADEAEFDTPFDHEREPLPPSPALESPLDQLAEHRREIEEAPLDFPPRPPASVYEDPASRHVEITSAVRVVVEQLRIAGEPDTAISRRLEQMGVDDPEAVLAQIRRLV